MQLNGFEQHSKRGRPSELNSVQSQSDSKRSRLGLTPSDLQQTGSWHDSDATLYTNGSRMYDNHAEAPAESEADAAYYGVMQMVHRVHGNDVSQAACHVKDQLRSLDPAEGIGVIAWLVDGMLSQHVGSASHGLIVDWVNDLADFAKHRIQSSRSN